MFAKFGTSMTCSILIYEFNGYLANFVAFLHPWLEPNIDARFGALTSWQLNAEREAKPAISG
jgi:hypothetical protein